MKIFLSHAKEDQDFVRRIDKDLCSHGHTTWLDEKDIPFGGAITEFIQKGLSDSDLLIVFLSTNSVLNTWVRSEWQSKFFNEIKKEKICIIPILIEKCEIPPILQGIRYADFSELDKYEENLSSLLKQFSMLNSQQENYNDLFNDHSIDSISEYTTELLVELEEEYIALPEYELIPIVETLKRINRSGKELRLRNYKHTIRIRTIYDHICSIAGVADYLLPYIEHGLQDYEYSELARCIAFHELNEVVLGDIPTYTTLTNMGRKATKNFAEVRLRTILPKDRERIANEFIWMFLGEKNKMSLEAVNEHLKNEKSNLYITFKMLDKIDPIITTWRYLHHYRGKLGSTPKEFNRRMKDFYENPDVKNYLIANKVDTKVVNMVLNLQDRKKAGIYYKDSDQFFNDENMFELPNNTVKHIIEKVPLFAEVPNEKTSREIIESGSSRRNI